MPPEARCGAPRVKLGKPRNSPLMTFRGAGLISVHPLELAPGWMATREVEREPLRGGTILDPRTVDGSHGLLARAFERPYRLASLHDPQQFHELASQRSPVSGCPMLGHLLGVDLVVFAHLSSIAHVRQA